MKIKDRTILYLDGQNVAPTEELLESLRPGVLKAKGVFETMRAKGMKVYALTEHLNRLNKGLKKLNIPWSIKKLEITKFIKALLVASRLADSRIRLSVWQKAGTIHSAVLIQSMTEPKKSFRVMISKYRRGKSTISKFKTLDYKVFYKAFKEAQARGFDEAVLLNSKQHVVEGSRTNIFVIKEGKLVTPPLQAGCLEGIARRVVLQAATELKIFCQQKNIKIENLYQADEVFLTNSVIGLMVVHQINQAKVGVYHKKSFIPKISRKYYSLLSKTLK